MFLKTDIVNGKVKIILKRDEEIDKVIRFKQSTLDQLEELRLELGVTTSETVGLIIGSFYDLYKDASCEGISRVNLEEVNVGNAELTQIQAKEGRKNKVRELLKKGVSCRAELSELVGVKKSRISEYLREIKEEDGHLYGYVTRSEIEQSDKEARIEKTIELRKLGYTRSELAEKVGVSKNTMNMYISEINKRVRGL